VLWFPLRFVARILVLSGLVSVVFQFAGAYILVTTYRTSEFTSELRQTALDLLRIGLGLLLIVLGMFAIIGSRFIYISYRGKYQPLFHASRPGAKWNRLNWAVCVTVMAITVSLLHQIAVAKSR
jgi:hypothetical protein